MQDQFDKVNGSNFSIDENQQIFLEATQKDPIIEKDVWKGNCRVSYCKPEIILVCNGSFSMKYHLFLIIKFTMFTGECTQELLQSQFIY